MWVHTFSFGRGEIYWLHSCLHWRKWGDKSRGTVTETEDNKMQQLWSIQQLGKGINGKEEITQIKGTLHHYKRGNTDETYKKIITQMRKLEK